MTREIIQELCEKKGITVSALEKELNYSNGALKKSDNIKAERLGELADYFGVSTDYLLGRDIDLDAIDKIIDYLDSRSVGMALIQTEQDKQRCVKRMLEYYKKIMALSEKDRKVIDTILEYEEE